jgi:hypothetical protein
MSVRGDIPSKIAIVQEPRLPRMSGRCAANQGESQQIQGFLILEDDQDTPKTKLDEDESSPDLVVV